VILSYAHYILTYVRKNILFQECFLSYAGENF
jgi:hypothetical protein